MHRLLDCTDVNVPPQRTASQLPITIGRYRVLGRLGRGAMGTVYSAYDDVMDRPVAIKVMMADGQDDPETSSRFYREAHAAGQLVHPNIITIFDLGNEDDRPYIVMELVEGRTLSEYLKRPEGVSLEQKLALMGQLCAGLQLAHGRGIFHRDIKPGNLLISTDGTLKIVDFGIARTAASSMTMSGLILGTPDYMSPEQARAEHVDERSDIFSAGAVFYYMLTGRKPFAAADLGTVLHKVQSEDPLPIRDAEAPPALVAIVTKALAKTPDARYQKATHMSADLVRVQRELAVEAKKVSSEVRSELDALAALEADRRRLCAELNVLPKSNAVAVFRRDLIARFPSVADWLDRKSDEAWDWAFARDRRAEVAAVRGPLDAEIDGLKQAAAHLENGAKAVLDGDLTRAMTCFDSAVQLIPSCERARDERIRIISLVAQKQAADDHRRALVIEARGAASRGEWATVLALTDQVLTADPGNATAATLRKSANDAMDAAARDLKQQCDKALDRADKLARKGRFTEAEQAIAEARHLDPSSPAVQALEARVRSARLDAEHAAAIEREAADILAAARLRFEKGERTEALEGLRGFLTREPQCASVASELAALTNQAEKIDAELRRRAEAADLAKAAEAAMNSDDPEGALAFTRQALAIDRNEPLAAKIKAVATARLREKAMARERAEAAESALQKARQHLSRGKFAAARDLASQASKLRPDNQEAAALLATIAEQESSAAETAQRKAEAERRAAAAAPILAMAKAAEGNKDFIRAGWLAENALALDVACDEARRIIERTREKVSEQPALADETVKVGGGAARASDPDDTVSLIPAVSAWRRLADALSRGLTQTWKSWLTR